AAVAEPGGVEVKRRPVELRGDEHAHGHAHDAPDDGGDRELADDLVVAETCGRCSARSRRCRACARDSHVKSRRFARALSPSPGRGPMTWIKLYRAVQLLVS